MLKKNNNNNKPDFFKKTEIYLFYSYSDIALRDPNV